MRWHTASLGESTVHINKAYHMFQQFSGRGVTDLGRLFVNILCVRVPPNFDSIIIQIHVYGVRVQSLWSNN